jgi:hypothetical protein
MSEVLLGMEWVVGFTVTIFLAIMGIYVFLMRHERELGELNTKLSFMLHKMGMNPGYQNWKKQRKKAGKKAVIVDEELPDE